MSGSYRIFTDINCAYFVTWTVVSWLKIFAQELYRKIILDALAYIRSDKNTELNAFVVMPSHVHAILWPQEEINLSDVIRDFKRFTSRAISNAAESKQALTVLNAFSAARITNRAQDRSRYQVWQEGSHAEAIYARGFAQQKLNYIHLNPVRAGLVDAASDWPYSSARAYQLGEETYPPTDIMMW